MKLSKVEQKKREDKLKEVELKLSNGEQQKTDEVTMKVAKKAQQDREEEDNDRDKYGVTEETFHLPFDQRGVNLSSWTDLPPFEGSNNLEITVGMSNWNRDGTIAECIESVCNQSFPNKNYEIIIVDDGSEDNSKKLIERTIKKYPDNLIKYYALKESRTFNEHHPHNVTIREARGKIFVKLSGDTLISKNYLEGVWRHHQSRENLFLHCLWGGVSKQSFAFQLKEIGLKRLLSRIIRETSLEEELIKDKIAPELQNAHDGKWPVDTGGSMLTKHWKEMRGFNELIKGNSVGDVEFMCRCTRKGIVFGYDPSLIMIHEHISSAVIKRGMNIKGPDWDPNEIIKNKNKYGDITEEDTCITTQPYDEYIEVLKDV